MSKFERFMHHLFWFIVSVFIGFVDIVNIYPNWKLEGMAFYGDWSYISFSCFQFFVCSCLYEIVFYLFNTIEEND